MTTQKTSRTGARRQRGAVGLIMPAMLIAIFSVGALAVDIARLIVVRNELQNAADAAALAGAAGLYPTNPAPNWSNGVAQGTSAVKLNKSSNVQLVSGTVQAGYWNLTGTPAGLQSQSITPGTNDVPAVQVTISRSTGNNGGPVATLLAPIFGALSANSSATAVAVITAPGSAGPGALFPIAISKCLYNLYWNYTTGQPKIDPSTGKPYVFQINTSYPSASSCTSGEWTGFNGPTDASTLKGLVQTGNTSTLNIGDMISTALATGVKSSVYQAIPSTPLNVTIPVVNPLNPGANEPVYAFAGFQITKVVCCGTKSTIWGSFISNWKVTNSGGGTGPYYGAYVPPRLAQ
ncbi:TadG family pilus assembly protein [Ralstonia pseudosolanacearum]